MARRIVCEFANFGGAVVCLGFPVKITRGVGAYGVKIYEIRLETSKVCRRAINYESAKLIAYELCAEWEDTMMGVLPNVVEYDMRRPNGPRD